MEYRGLALAWRPKGFDDVVGQGHITRALTNAVSQGRVAQAYLFSGMRGVGKTTMARILAKAMNCAQGPTPTPCHQCDPCREITGGISLDVLEIDGASNNSVDDVRDLIEKIKYVPLKGRYKVYIIDEVHMLSASAFNALLKTVEEPPPHVIFIFATTEVQKIPATILSRCQQFTFKRLPRREIVDRLRRVAQEEKMTISDRSLLLIAKASEGSMRDAISLLDQAVSFRGQEIADEDIILLVGSLRRENLLALTEACCAKDSVRGLAVVKEILEAGHEPRQACLDFLEHLRNLIVAKVTKEQEAFMGLPAEEIEELAAVSEKFSSEDIQRLFTLFSKTLEDMRGSPIPGILLEMAVMKAAGLASLTPLSEVLTRLTEMEERLSGSGPLPSPSQAPLFPSASDEEQRGLSRAEPRGRSGTGSSSMAGGENPNTVKESDTASRWKALLQRLREEKPPLGSYLEKGHVVRATMEGNRVEVRIGYSKGHSVFIDLVSKGENLQFITSLAREVFGQEVIFRFETVSSADPSSPEPPAIVQEALKIFGGEAAPRTRDQ